MVLSQTKLVLKNSSKINFIPRTPFAFIWFVVKPYKKLLFLAIFLTFLQQVFSDSISYTLKGFVDTASVYRPGESTQGIFLWLIASMSLLLLSVITIRCIGFIMNYYTVHARTDSVKHLFNYLSLHSLSYFNDKFSGSLASRVGIISSNTSRLTSRFINNFLSIFFSIIVTFFLINSASTSLAMIFIFGVIVLIPFNYFLTRKQIKLSSKTAELSARLQGQVVDTITNITAVQQYAQRNHEIERIDKTVKEYRTADVKSDNFRERILIANNFLIWIFISSIIFYTFVLWTRNTVSVGELVMVVSLTMGFMRALTHIGQTLNDLMEFYGEVKNGLDEIIVPHTITDSLVAKSLDPKSGEVVFEKVHFAYAKGTEDVFKKLSLEVKGGEKIGIVGFSGAGKTTLMKLLIRQHDIQSGDIRIDGQSIKNITLESLRKNISIVPQEPILFHRTIRENIRYGKLNATDKEIEEVAKKAQAHDFIEASPNKYDSLVGERGVKLSVGQRQRIIIARAFLKDAPILILDEATSALDSESEVAIQKALQVLMKGKTVFAIAHRLSTLRDMDRILVFKEGEIVENGSHDSLLAKKGLYSSFWNHQAGGFIGNNK